MKYKLVVIEDNDDIRLLLTELLNANDFEVETAENGFVGIQKILDQEPDLVLCDIMMPGLNGYEVLKTIRKSAKVANIPFIFLSAKNERSEVRSGMELGADDYITKPFEELELINAIITRLERTRKQKEELFEKVQIYKDNISAVYSHEVNTPLNGIMGLSDLILKYYKDALPNHIIEMVGHIQEASQRLHRTTNNLILYADIQKYKAENYQQKTGLVPIISYKETIMDIVNEIASSYKRENDLNTVFQDANLKISERDFTKIIYELVDNAFKYSEESTLVEIKSTIDNMVINFDISDSGNGFKQEWIDEIGPFVQFNREYHEQQGMGLGLFFAKVLTEFNFGKFTIEPKEKGTKVCIQLPLTEPE